MKIYTKKGDDGSTALLFAGKDRVSKAALRPSAYGDGDEAVSALGLARAVCTEPELADLILRLQREMFVVNAELATGPEHHDRLEDGLTRVTAGMTSDLEPLIDDYESRIPEIKDFVVPGGTPCGAHLDHATRVVRRAERSAVRLSEAEQVSGHVLRYLNRLADLVWTLARYADRDQGQVKVR